MQISIGKLVTFKFNDDNEIFQKILIEDFKGTNYSFKDIITTTSPVGEAIMGKQKNDIVYAKIDNKKYPLTILDVEEG